MLTVLPHRGPHYARLHAAALRALARHLARRKARLERQTAAIQPPHQAVPDGGDGRVCQQCGAEVYADAQRGVWVDGQTGSAECPR